MILTLVVGSVAQGRDKKDDKKPEKPPERVVERDKNKPPPTPPPKKKPGEYWDIFFLQSANKARTYVAGFFFPKKI